MSYPIAHPVLDAGPFVRVRVAPRRPRVAGSAPVPDVVLVSREEPLRPDALVVARDRDGLALRRVGKVGADAVELLPESADVRPIRAEPVGCVLGTVLMRWRTDG